MNRLLLAALILGATILPSAVSAQGYPYPTPPPREYALYAVTINPFTKTLIAGPFDSFAECNRMAVAEGYTQGVFYECFPI